jgi:hypothetical protein
MPENRVLCYFDAVTAPEKLIVWHGIRGYVAPLEIIKPLPSLFAAYGLPWSFKIHYNMIYKLGLVEGPEPLSIIWGEEINGFVLSGEAKSGKPGRAIPAEELAELLLEYAGYLGFPVVNPDKHYSFIPYLTGKVFFASERFIVTLFLITTGLFLILYLLYSARYNAVLLFHIRLLFKSFWVLLLLLLLFIFTFKISRLFYYLYVFGIILFFDRFPIKERFYGFGAVIIIIFGLFSTAFMDISYILIFLWALLFVLIGSSVSNPVLIFLSALLTPFLVLIALYEIIKTNQSAGFFSLFALHTPGSWLTAFQTGILSLTVLLFIKRGTVRTRILLKRRLKPERKNKVFFRIILTAMFSLSLIAISLAPKRQASSVRRLITDIPLVDDILALSLSGFEFQGSRIIMLNLEAKGSPVRFDISIVSVNGESLLPGYSAPVLLEREDDGKKISLVLGEHPPNPLVLEIVLPLEFKGLLETAAIYNVWDSSIDPGEKPLTEDYAVKVVKSTDLRIQDQL